MLKVFIETTLDAIGIALCLLVVYLCLLVTCGGPL